MGTFPVGYHTFHKNSTINFQMNRWYSSGCLDYEDLQDAAERIHNFADWTYEFKFLAEEARQKDNMVACATYLRAAQFFTFGDGPEKLTLYDDCIDAYDKAYRNQGFYQEQIPFNDVFLPVMRMNHKGSHRGTVILHGGYDSFIQEFVPYMKYVFKQGFDVYMFEGPGQGKALYKYGLNMTHEWEYCTSAVLDFYGLHDVTIIGVSLGGYLATRAAAFDSRISRVVMYDVIYDFYKALMSNTAILKRVITNLLLPFDKAPMWAKLENDLEKDLFSLWLIKQGYFIFGVDNLPDYIKCLKRYNTRDISSLVTQDVLILAGADDLYTIYTDKQKKALTHARSVNSRVFTKEENASHHCQVGNIQLALDVILDWITEKDCSSTVHSCPYPHFTKS
ncbi:MAG: alpha/beta fold hydrolase [Bacillus sp. (in: firmicutes)]